MAIPCKGCGAPQAGSLVLNKPLLPAQGLLIHASGSTCPILDESDVGDTYFILTEDGGYILMEICF